MLSQNPPLALPVAGQGSRRAWDAQRPMRDHGGPAAPSARPADLLGRLQLENVGPFN